MSPSWLGDLCYQGMYFSVGCPKSVAHVVVALDSV